ncbi:MAG: hypothetical protein K8L99_15075, partial [Anaerolineae bacterium]|nr:hypothetical protein [Anaerolineae bacterium]
MVNKHAIEDDFEIQLRSAFMRLYRSRLSGEDGYPAPCLDPAIVARFLAAGWVEQRGQGWRLTELGVTVWAQKNRKLLKRAAACPGPLFNELRWKVGLPLLKAQLNRPSRVLLQRL